MSGETVARVGCTPEELEGIRAGRRCAFGCIAPELLAVGDTIELYARDNAAPLRVVVADRCKDVVVVASAFDELWTLGGVEALRITAPNVNEVNGRPTTGIIASFPFWSASASRGEGLGVRMASKEGPHDALRQLVRALRRERE